MPKKITTKDFIEKAKEVHGELYDYSFTEYASASAKVEIGCRKHGSFWQAPNKHVSSRAGCPTCGKEKPKVKPSTRPKRVRRPTRGRAAYTTDKFIALCNEQHGSKYTYDKVVYATSLGKVTVTCPAHGDFSTVAASHRRGTGCPTCSTSGYDVCKPGFFYLLSDDVFTKVGITNRASNARTKEIAKGSGLKLTKRYSLCFDDGSVAKLLEKSVLLYLKQSYKQTEDVFNGSTECFVGVDQAKLLTLISEQVNILTDK